MTVLPISFYPDPILSRICDPIEVFDESVKEMSADLIESLCAYGGLGLAAPQCGIAKQMFVCQIGKIDIMTFINPVLEREMGDELTTQEGCLSIPGVTGRIKRNDRILIKAQDITGAPFSISLINTDAIAFQHELDHLHGRTMFEVMDRIQKLGKRNSYIKKVKKWKASQKKTK